MKKSSNVCFITIVLMTIFMLLNMFIFSIKSIYIFQGVLLLASLLLFFLSGYEKNNYRNKKDIFYNILIILMIYFLVTYVLGIFTGFLKNSYSLKFINIIKNVIPYLILILIRELFRYLYFCKNYNSKILYSLGLIFFVLLDINLSLGLYGISNTGSIIKTICFVLFPSVSKNVLLNFLTVKSGCENAIFYSCVMELNTFILPFFPNFGDYINIILNTLLPIYIVNNLNDKLNFKDERKIVSSRYKSKKLILYSIITFFMLVIVMLTSGYFKYYAVTIGSSSMTPNIKVGDVVIVKKLKKNELEKIKKGDILVYKHDGKLIVHRLVEIKTLNKTKYYITKGDNNIVNDSYVVTKDDIIGVKFIKIPYIGMPTVELNQRIEN